jgi:hypothetical protein
VDAWLLHELPAGLKDTTEDKVAAHVRHRVAWLVPVCLAFVNTECTQLVPQGDAALVHPPPPPHVDESTPTAPHCL